MIKVTLIGTGNVSWHLNEIFARTKGVTVDAILSSRGNDLSKSVKEIASKDKSDVYIIAVSDDAITPVSQVLKDVKKLFVHTSGSVAMNALSQEGRRGVFYPLQTFSKEREVDFKALPICIEAEKKEDLKLLEELARTVSSSVYEITSQQRKSLHLAAVFVNNFTNHLYQIGSELCEQNNVPFEILKPLIVETARKISSLTPIDSQTGPARRADNETITKQINQLENKNHKEIYKTITESILKTYGKKL